MHFGAAPSKLVGTLSHGTSLGSKRTFVLLRPVFTLQFLPQTDFTDPELRIDGQPYAIKKVKARSKSSLDPVLSEVTVLSRLNHPNVVRYFAAWIDDGIVVDDHLNTESSGDETLSSLANGEHKPVLPPSSRGLDFISSSNAHIVFGNDTDADTIAEEYRQDESSDDEDADQSSGSSHGQIEPDSDELDRKSPTMGAKSGSDSQKQATWTVLYIQMEYCKPEVGSLSVTNFEACGIGQKPQKYEVIVGSI